MFPILIKRLWNQRSKKWNKLTSQRGVWRRTVLTNRGNSEDWRTTLCLNLEMFSVKTPAEEEGKRWHREWDLDHSEELRLSWEEQGLLSREWPVCKSVKERERQKEKTHLLGIFLWTQRKGPRSFSEFLSGKRAGLREEMAHVGRAERLQDARVRGVQADVERQAWSQEQLWAGGRLGGVSSCWDAWDHLRSVVGARPRTHSGGPQL